MRDKLNYSVGCLLAGCATLSLCPPTARAETAPSSALEEVVVTAQKRSENVQEVPASVSVITTQALDNFHVTQLADIGAYVPGLQIDSGGSPGQTTISIRGIAPIGRPSTVGTYIDETPLGTTSIYDRGSLYALDLLPYDVERIEVLEGPQGTLYGASSLGGTLKYITVKPNLDKTEFRVGADVFGVSGAGNPGGGGRAMINTSLIDGQLGLIASVASETTPGFIDNFRTGQQGQNTTRQQSGRLGLMWQPSSALSIRFDAIIQHIIADGNATVALDPNALQPIGGERGDNNYLPNVFKSNLQYYSLTANWDLDWAKLVSATSFSNQRTQVNTDATPTYGPIITLVGGPQGALSEFDLGLGLRKWTQEIRLSSPENQTLEWLVGAFYTHETNTNFQVVTAQNPNGSSVTGMDPILTAELPTIYREYAGFGDLTYHITSQFDVSGGVRYAKNDQDFVEDIGGPGILVGNSNQTGNSSEGVWTYSVSPRYRITKDIMAYARVATGYQAGGPNLTLPTVPEMVKADRLTNYELGLKSTFWDRRAIVNASVYDLEWKDLQVLGVTSQGITYQTNGGTARVQGAEIDATVKPINQLVLQATGNYNDAKLTEDVPSIGGFSGDRLPNVPKWSGSLRADYSIPVNDDWTAHAGAGLRLVGMRFAQSPTIMDQYKLGAYGALDLNFALSSSRYTVRLFGKNVMNRRAYLTAGAIQDGLTGDVTQLEATILQPRTIGLAFDAQF